MAPEGGSVFSFVVRLTAVVGCSVILWAFGSQPFIAQSQSDCRAYNQCLVLQQVSSAKVSGPVTYWFDDERITPFLSPEAAADFKSHVRAAANDWAAKIGVPFNEVSSGGKVRIIISTVPSIRAVNGQVIADQTFPGTMRITFSDEWPEWIAQGKQRLTSHEWGHIVGFEDLAESGCPNVETIMRQFSPNSATFDNQLKGLAPLPSPTRPNFCDACEAKSKHGLPLDLACVPCGIETETCLQDSDCCVELGLECMGGTCGYPDDDCDPAEEWECWQYGGIWDPYLCYCDYSCDPYGDEEWSCWVTGGTWDPFNCICTPNQGCNPGPALPQKAGYGLICEANGVSASKSIWRLNHGFLGATTKS